MLSLAPPPHPLRPRSGAPCVFRASTWLWSRALNPACRAETGHAATATCMAFAAASSGWHSMPGRRNPWRDREGLSAACLCGKLWMQMCCLECLPHLPTRHSYCRAADGVHCPAMCSRAHIGAWPIPAG